MTTIHHSPPPGATPFAIYEDAEDNAPPSPSEVYEGDVLFHSEISIPGADEVIASIETEHETIDEPEPYVSSYTSRPSILSTSSQSRRVSGVTSTSFISSLPSEISVSSKPIVPANNVDSRYTPRKERPPFRNPASVRAMQMSSPPPLPAYDTPRERLKGNYKLATPSRGSRSETVSTTGSRRRSKSHRDSVHSEFQALQSPRATPAPQQSLPLVLLHVTILPIQLPYAHDFMITAMPGWLVENYRVLGEKLQDIVLMRRGILIQHPRDEYDLLEERILESLELKTPRLLKCGHFVGPDADVEDDDQDDEDSGSVTDGGTGRGSRMSGGTITAEDEAEWKYPTPESDDASLCTDCHQQVKRPGRGVGTGTKRWEIKIYAANGLMRAGAWSAAWSEMERCDVEISPWIPEDVRKALDKRLEEEQEAAQRKRMYAAELERQIAEEAATQKRLAEEVEAKRRADEAERQRQMEVEAAALQQKLEEEAAEKRRLEETLDEKIEEAKETIRLEFEAQAMAEANSIAERFRAMEEALKREQEKHTRSRSRGRQRSTSGHPSVHEIPISTLLKNYLLLLLQDSRNYLIVILAALVVFLVTNANPHWGLNTSALDMAATVPLGHVVDPVPSMVVTTTATMTATATSVTTLTVTELQQVGSAQEIPLSSSPTNIAEVADMGISTASQIISAAIESGSPGFSQEMANDVPASAVSQELSEESVISAVAPEPADPSITTTSASVPAVSDEPPSSASSLIASDVSNEVTSLPPATELEDASLATTTPESTPSNAGILDIFNIQETDNPDAQEASETPLDASDKDEL
ncbi:hypothetical protein K458DRAFT_304585 [Lentithecium fluviatile CBS 122367]|uniref:Pathway-specific nitrogen regulator n=1 Tax=Lentithecium fluviatile CBS 122367 TaxID=1168545 RepID=A0A6G1IZ93_9PLEO|nr:hypothetical protein K458DRAFT_304585 [Lentithecium fluviatile CBS 122367]